MVGSLFCSYLDQHFRMLQYVTRDGFAALVKLLHKLILEKYTKLQEQSKSQVW